MADIHRKPVEQLEPGDMLHACNEDSPLGMVETVIPQRWRDVEEVRVALVAGGEMFYLAGEPVPYEPTTTRSARAER